MPTLFASGRLARYHLRRDDLALFDILKARNTSLFFWAEPDNAQVWAGIGCEARVTADGSERFDIIRQKAAGLLSNVTDLNEPPTPTFPPRLFGGFGFSTVPAAEPWTDFSPADFILPRIQATRLNNETWLTVNHWLGPDEQPEALRTMLEAEARALHPQPVSPHPCLLEANDQISFLQWQTIVEQAVRFIRAGEMQKVVLARTRAAQFDMSIDPLSALKRLNQRYLQTYRFLFSPRPGRAFFGATPELLARVEKPHVYSVALAGSIASGTSPIEIDALAEALLNSPKDRHEHALVVEAIRGVLEPMTVRLELGSIPKIRRLANIQHLETPVQGVLADGHDIHDVISALHPTPALGGVPRQSALDFILHNEPVTRGWYAAPIGWLDAEGNGLFAVAIRSALCDGNKALLYAGAGIVDGSDPMREWQETELKFQPLMEALAG